MRAERLCHYITRKEVKTMRVKWETWGGSKFEGEIVDVDSNVLHIRLDNGEMKAVEASDVVIVKE